MYLQSFFVHFNWTSFFSFQVVRHPVPGVRGPAARPRYGQSQSNETSPLAARKSSAPASPSPVSPAMSRRSVGPLATVTPQRPSKLPVMPMYGHPGHNARAGAGRLQGYTNRQKTTSPDSGVMSDQETLSPASPGSRYRLVTSKRPASPPRTGSKRPGQASPKRGDINRRVSSPVYSARRRSPSLSRSVSCHKVILILANAKSHKGPLGSKVHPEFCHYKLKSA